MYAVVYETTAASGQVESGKIAISGGKAVAVGDDLLCRRIVATPIRRGERQVVATDGRRFINFLPGEYSGTKVRIEVIR